METIKEIGLVEIQQATRQFADERAKLVEIVSALNEKVEALRREALPMIKRAVARTAERQGELKAMLEAAPGLFVKPRTVIFHGVKVGFQKGKGGVDWDEDEKVVALIEKHFPRAQAELLIKTTKKPIVKALEDLDVSDLKRIGCRVLDTGDEAVIRPVDGEVDKIVKALLEQEETD